MSREINEYDSVSQFEENRRRYVYTVQRADSSLSNGSTKAEKSHCYAVLLCAIKWLIAIFLCAVVLYCVVASKICLLVLGQHFRSVKGAGNSNTEKIETQTSKQALFLMLLFTLMIPHVASFIYASWTSLRRKSRPWPTKQGFVMIMFGGFLETVSLCYITMVMLTVVPITANAIILVMCSLPMMPAIWEAIKSRSQWRTLTGKRDVIKFGASATFAVIGIALLLYKMPDTSGQIGIPVSLTLLSIAWSPKTRKLQIQSNANTYDQKGNDANSDMKQSARGKAAIVSSLWNLVLTPLVAVALAKIYQIVELDNISSGFKAINATHRSFVFFMVHIVASFFGYHFGWLACSLCMQRTGYALPLTLATPIAVIMTHLPWFCQTNTIPLPCISADLVFSLPAGALLWLAQFFATTYYVWKSQGLVMAKASDLLWIPSYNGVCLEQYLLLNRRNKFSDEEHKKQEKMSTNVKIFICTTMYHEEDYEMEQLLRSIHDVDTHSKASGRHYESHIFFDGCVRAEKLNTFVIQLASLVEKTLKVHLRNCNKIKTPYGMQLKWELPGGMEFTIHLKDNVKVKNKKRWSQVMYMSYVLDYKEDILEVKDDQSFILTTDADVKFTHESVEALIDQIVEDPQIGAVCARTHPMGNGPVVWYQIFDYAIGHWFQKVANHMLGSVLCSPGCFSLYRCQAVRDVLPTYATGVDHAFDFLTKDMGEDRWMCTLMIQRGWRLTYCAAAVDSTYCPESFDEFYKQRRRWTPSTLANLVLLIKEWKLVLKKNEHISFLFIVYQTFLVCSSLIGPSTVILVIVGGMVYSGINLNEIAIVVLVCLVVVAYTLVCLFTSQNFQLKISKILTFVFAVIMCIVVIGVAVQISKELQEREVEPTALPTLRPNTTTTPATKPLEHHLPAGISTLYLAGLAGIFVAAALLHANEFTCLLHAVWYLMCLPSGYLLLTVYSVCNITDRSWGTREGKSVSESQDWYKPLSNWMKEVCTCFHCCGNRKDSGRIEHASNQEAKRDKMVDNFSHQTRTNKTVTFPPRGEQANRMGDGGFDENVKPKKAECKQKMDSMILASKSSRRHIQNDDKVTVVYSAEEIPNKNRAKRRPLEKMKSKEAIESNRSVKHTQSKTGFVGESCEKAVQTEVLLNGQHLSMRDVNTDDHDVSPSPLGERNPLQKSLSSTSRGFSSMGIYAHVHRAGHNPSSDLENELPLHTDSSRFPFPNSAASNDGTYGYGETMHRPQESSAIQPGCRNDNRELQGESLAKPTVSALITASTTITADTEADQKQSGDSIQTPLNSASSSWCGSSIHLRVLEENGHPPSRLKNEVSYSDLGLPVEEWLTDDDFKSYASKFRKHGYDTTGFLPGMTDKDLETIGIETRGHRKKLLKEIKKIPRLDIEEGIPDDVQEWLNELGLKEYWPTFQRSGYKEPSDLEDLKGMGKENIKATFNIRKQGHLNRLISAIRKLQYSNQGQEKIRHTRRELDRLSLSYLDEDDLKEYEFWEGLRQTCLVPELSAFDQTSELKAKLVELRNTTLMIFAVTNALWMIIILTLVQHKDLKVLGVDIIGLGFLTIYGCIFVIQFVALLGHRFKTLVHVLARTPWKVSNGRVCPTEQAVNAPQTA